MQPSADLLLLPTNVIAGRLENGLRYVVITDDHAEIGLGIDAGQLQEEDGQSGVAQLVPQVLVHSVASPDPDEHEPWPRAMGDYTEIVLDWVTNPNLAIARVRGWLDAELMPESFASIMQDRARFIQHSPELGEIFGDELTRFSGTRLVRHPWRGTTADAEHLDLAALRRFRARWYVPARMTLAVRGPWKRDVVVALIEQTFSSLPARPSPSDPPLIEGPRGIAVASGCCYLHMSFLVDKPAPRTRKDMRVRLVRELFERCLVRRLRYALTLWGVDHGQALMWDDVRLSRRVVSFELELVTDVSKDIAAALLVQELERVRLHGFTRAELRNAREPDPPPSSGVILGEPHDQADCSLPIERAFLGFLPIPCEVEARLMRELLPTIRDDEIEALRASIDPRRAAIGAIDGVRSTATAVDIRAAVDRALAQRIAPWSELPALMPAHPQPGRIVQEIPHADGVDLVFQNGVRARVRRSQTERIAIHASSPGGAFAVADEDVAFMPNVATMVAVAGLGTHDGLMTHRLLAHHGIELKLAIDRRHEDVRGSAPPASAEQLFQAVHLAMVANRVDAYSSKVGYEHWQDNDKAVAARITARLVAELGVDGALVPSADHALALFRQRFGNAGDFVFEISGPVEVARLKELAATYIGSLPDDGRREAVAPLQIIPTKTEVSVTTGTKYSCSIEVSWTMPVQPGAGPPDELRLWTAVTRELLGGVVSSSGSRRDDLGYVLHVGGMYDCSDPKHLDEDSIRDRLARLALRTYSDQEVEDVRTSYAHVDPEEPEAAREAQAITAADIARVMARFQPPAEVLVVRVVD